ncbi:hypothetical protein PLEOSDRAFT_1062463 [Pleurotus ostreatus PC15]|uniref:Uncharacterized protein n=1 Tax=Pleurotus ostreatus (strain PC15) TaxID=1137138 RepID=A0A067P3J1_PLEO1|nr:hypothetical protein PLEOSDRAFT_1062463 [Pleurotus ostreatus PC15]
MRVKQIWEYVPIPAKLKLVSDRITSTRLTLGYFLFSFAHFVVQVAIQAKAFTINATAASFLWDIVTQAKTTSNAFPVFRGSEFHLCDSVPTSIDTKDCQLLWKAQAGNSSTPAATSLAFENAVPTSSTPITSPVSLPAALATGVPSSNPTRVPLSSVTAALSTTPSFASATTTTVTRSAPATAPTSSAVKSDESSDDSGSESEDDKPILALVDADGMVSVTLSGMGYNGRQVVLDKTCLWALNYPVSILNNTKREDIVFIAFQFWVLGMSLVAILNESIPHIIASLLTHVLATGWAAFQISHTAGFQSSFNQLITKGACSGVQLLPNYWQDRHNSEVPSLVLNIVALLISVFLTWRLIKLFGWQTFKRVGASLTINRVYKIVLSLSIAIQISLFFIAVTVGLWIDQLFNGAIGQLAAHKKLYEILFIITLILILPWLILGWFSVRRELRVPMLVFLGLTVMYMVGWGVMFMSNSFRWTFVTWRFFSMMAVASVALTLATFILGVVCRCNFGKGLPRYLNYQEPLPGDDFVPIRPGFAGGDPEKVEFPSNEKPIPTWSVTFGQGNEVPVPRQMFPPPYAGNGTRMGPRFSNASSEPFETASSMSSVRYPTVAHTRDDSRSTFGSDSDHGMNRAVRENGTILSSPTTLQYYSLERSLSQASTTTSESGRKRWIIE